MMLGQRWGETMQMALLIYEHGESGWVSKVKLYSTYVAGITEGTAELGRTITNKKHHGRIM